MTPAIPGSRDVADACAPQRAATPPITISRLTNAKGSLTKRVALAHDGTLTKKAAAHLSAGKVERIEVGGLDEFANLLGELHKNQALAYGVTDAVTATVVSKRKLHQYPDAVARDREHFHFPAGAGVMMIDHDPPAGADGLAADALHASVVEATPALADGSALWTASASSCIVNAATGEPLAGQRGSRLYVPVRRGVDIPRAGAALYNRTWLAGQGYYAISKAGTLLERSVIDASVWQPERLDFAAGADCAPPLEQQRPAPKLYGDPKRLFDSTLILKLTDAERDALASIKAEAKAKVAERAAEVREAYIKAKGKEIADRRGLTPEQGEKIARSAVQDSALLADFILFTESGEAVMVGAVLDDPERWHGARFPDPLEPDYAGDSRIAWANLRGGGRPYIYSHAHGGRRYWLHPQPKTLIVSTDLSGMADRALEVLRVTGNLYDRVATLVRASRNEALTVVSPVHLHDILGREIQWQRPAKDKTMLPAAAPRVVADFIAARGDERRLPQVDAVVTAPTLRPDGSILDVPGYDEVSRLLYVSPEAYPARVPPEPTRAQAIAALRTLCQPVAGFPFVDSLSRSVALAAKLTAAVRPALPTAPGFAIDAPAAGTGKTMLARVIGGLTGSDPRIEAPPTDEPEAEKRLLTAVREGANVVLWDNLVKPLEGAALCAWLTSPIFSGRLLGQSASVAGPNRALFLATGNNVRVAGDACRRVLMCRLDAKCESPFARSFDFDPVQLVGERRQSLVRAALTLMRFYLTRGLDLTLNDAGSFPEWDALVRRTVVFLSHSDIGLELCDPFMAAFEAVAADPHREVLLDLLRAWRKNYGDEWVSARTVLQCCDGPLTDALEAITNGDRKFGPKNLGRWLLVHREQRVDGLMLLGRDDPHSKIKQWTVREVA